MVSGDTDGNLDVLLRWFRDAADRGLMVPESKRLTEISRHPADWWMSATDPVELAWRPTVDHLFHQVRLGVFPAAAVDFLPDALRTPPGGATCSGGPGGRGPDAGIGRRGRTPDR